VANSTQCENPAADAVPPSNDIFAGEIDWVMVKIPTAMFDTKVLEQQPDTIEFSGSGGPSDDTITFRGGIKDCFCYNRISCKL
jgi:hypothetical protein